MSLIRVHSLGQLAQAAALGSPPRRRRLVRRRRPYMPPRRRSGTHGLITIGALVVGVGGLFWLLYRREQQMLQGMSSEDRVRYAQTRALASIGSALLR